MVDEDEDDEDDEDEDDDADEDEDEDEDEDDWVSRKSRVRKINSVLFPIGLKDLWARNCRNSLGVIFNGLGSYFVPSKHKHSLLGDPPWQASVQYVPFLAQAQLEHLDWHLQGIV